MSNILYEITYKLINPFYALVQSEGNMFNN
jgi:hypothetical protein